MNALGNKALAKHAPPVVQVLEECKEQLVRLGNDGERTRMPPVAFKIARATKELVLRVDRIETGELREDQKLSLDL